MLCSEYGQQYPSAMYLWPLYLLTEVVIQTWAAKLVQLVGALTSLLVKGYRRVFHHRCRSCVPRCGWSVEEVSMMQTLCPAKHASWSSGWDGRAATVMGVVWQVLPVLLHEVTQCVYFAVAGRNRAYMHPSRDSKAKDLNLTLQVRRVGEVVSLSY